MLLLEDLLETLYIIFNWMAQENQSVASNAKLAKCRVYLLGREHGMSDLVAARKFLDTAEKLDPLTFYNVYT